LDYDSDLTLGRFQLGITGHQPLGSCLWKVNLYPRLWTTPLQHQHSTFTKLGMAHLLPRMQPGSRVLHNTGAALVGVGGGVALTGREMVERIRTSCSSSLGISLIKRETLG